MSKAEVIARINKRLDELRQITYDPIDQYAEQYRVHCHFAIDELRRVVKLVEEIDE